ncbi:hypothetical protein ACWEO4_10245 [Streptomyces sp. NPDC004393]|uniref:hypothetical protein n=1 Tax=Streptomyces sp. NPDC004533 TaxID=3154278 RepID=UPI0033A8FD86
MPTRSAAGRPRAGREPARHSHVHEAADGGLGARRTAIDAVAALEPYRRVRGASSPEQS